MAPRTKTPIERLFWRPRTLSEATGVSLTTVYDAIYSGKLRARQLNGRSWLIDPADASAWITSESKLNVEETAA